MCIIITDRQYKFCYPEKPNCLSFQFELSTRDKVADNVKIWALFCLTYKCLFLPFLFLSFLFTCCQDL